LVARIATGADLSCVDNDWHAQATAIGSKIRTHRRAKGMTQAAMADALKVSFQSIQAWESGQVLASIHRLTGIAKTLEVPLSALLPDELAKSAKAKAPRQNELLLKPVELKMIKSYRQITSNKSRTLARNMISALAENTSKPKPERS
jgi:transcriptional regulator with XRE-family HTH domain